MPSFYVSIRVHADIARALTFWKRLHGQGKKATILQTN